MISYDHYRVFCCAARHRSFSRAAQELLTSQPAVSRSVATLEEQLQCRLFQRTGRGIVLTPEGRRLYEATADACQVLEEAERMMASARALEMGAVRVGTTELAMRYVLIEAIGRFQRQYPGVKFRVSSHSTAAALESLREGEADLAVVPAPSEAPSGLQREGLLSFQDIFIAGRPFTARKGEVLSLRDLAGYPLICLTPETTSRQFLEQLYRRHGLTVTADMEVTTADLVLPLVREGLGVGFLPQLLAREAVAAGEVFPLIVREAVPRRQVCLVTDPVRPRSRAAEGFVAFLRREKWRDGAAPARSSLAGGK